MGFNGPGKLIHSHLLRNMNSQLGRIFRQRFPPRPSGLQGFGGLGCRILGCRVQGSGHAGSYDLGFMVQDS